jgi:hypothetical protein
MAFTKEQQDAFDKYLINLIHNKMFHDISDHEKARQILDLKDEDGKLIFINTDNKQLYNDRTIRGRIEKFIDHCRGTDSAYSREIQKYLMEEVMEIARDINKNPKLGQLIIEKFMPGGGDASGGQGITPRAQALRDKIGVVVVNTSGTDTVVTGYGDTGPPGADRGDIVADGRGEDITAEAVSSGHDNTVHEVHPGGDTAEGSVVPDTSVPSEDSVDNDSGGGLGPA